MYEYHWKISTANFGIKCKKVVFENIEWGRKCTVTDKKSEILQYGSEQ